MGCDHLKRECEAKESGLAAYASPDQVQRAILSHLKLQSALLEDIANALKHHNAEPKSAVVAQPVSQEKTSIFKRLLGL